MWIFEGRTKIHSSVGTRPCLRNVTQTKATTGHVIYWVWLRGLEKTLSWCSERICWKIFSQLQWKILYLKVIGILYLNSRRVSVIFFPDSLYCCCNSCMDPSDHCKISGLYPRSPHLWLHALEDICKTRPTLWPDNHEGQLLNSYGQLLILGSLNVERIGLCFQMHSWVVAQMDVASKR